MRLAKTILVGIQLVIFFLVILGFQYVTLTAIALPSSGEVERVQLTNCTEDNVCYADSADFWATNIGQSYTMSEPKLMIRSLFKWQWWQDGMKWADWVITYGTEFITPIVGPVYVINDMHLYYGMEATIDDVALILSIKDDMNYELAHDRVEYAYSIREDGYQLMNRASWNKDYKDIYNIEILIAKYNAHDGESFAKFEAKFFDDEGEFKAVGTLLFYQILLSMLLAMYFAYQMPIIVDQNIKNQTELKSDIGPRLPKIRLIKRRNKKKLGK